MAPPIFSALPRDEVGPACGRQANGFYVHSRHDENFSECERAAGFGGDIKHDSLLRCGCRAKLADVMLSAFCSLVNFNWNVERCSHDAT
jgi:hypothetical protein